MERKLRRHNERHEGVELFAMLVRAILVSAAFVALFGWPAFWQSVLMSVAFNACVFVDAPYEHNHDGKHVD